MLFVAGGSTFTVVVVVVVVAADDDDDDDVRNKHYSHVFKTRCSCLPFEK